MKTSLFLLNISGVTDVFKRMAYIFCSLDKNIPYAKMYILSQMFES